MKSPLSILAWVLLGAVILASFLIDWRNTAQGGAIDLRDRITGVRLLVHGIDPYHFRWHAGDLPEYCDPSDKLACPVSRTTASPALVLLHLPLAVLPYRVAQFLWLAAQWGLLLGTAGLWGCVAVTPRARWLIAAVIVGFSLTAEWRLHAERGQAYVLLSFLFAYWLTATREARPNRQFLTGLLAGLLIALRPPFLLLVPFLVQRCRGQLAGATIGLLLGLGLPMICLPGCWADYFSATQTFSYLYRHGIHFSLDQSSFPPVIENLPLGIIGHSLYLPDSIFSVHAFLERMKREPFPASIPIVALGILFAVWLWIFRRKPLASLLSGMAAWLFLADLCLPVYRESYDDVLILNVIAAGLAVSPRIPCAGWPGFAAALIGAIVYFRNLDHPWVILPSALFTVAAIIALFPSSPASGTPGTRRKAAASD